MILAGNANSLPIFGIVTEKGALHLVKILFTFFLVNVKINKCVTGRKREKEENVKMPYKNFESNLNFLFDLFLQVENKEECAALFDDLCTPNELAAMSQRAVVARMLTQKRVYSDIVSETGASTATVSRVNRSLTLGKNGYQTLFKKLDEKGD